MTKYFIVYGTVALLAFAGILLIRNGLKKENFKSAMNLVHYKPIRNYGKGFSIALGVLCLALAVMLLVVKSK